MLHGADAVDGRRLRRSQNRIAVLTALVELFDLVPPYTPVEIS